MPIYSLDKGDHFTGKDEVFFEAVAFEVDHGGLAVLFGGRVAYRNRALFANATEPLLSHRKFSTAFT